jgi:hypothetical protein
LINSDNQLTKPSKMVRILKGHTVGKSSIHVTWMLMDSRLNSTPIDNASDVQMIKVAQVGGKPTVEPMISLNQRHSASMDDAVVVADTAMQNTGKRQGIGMLGEGSPIMIVAVVHKAVVVDLVGMAKDQALVDTTKDRCQAQVGMGRDRAQVDTAKDRLDSRVVVVPMVTDQSRSNAK